MTLSPPSGAVGRELLGLARGLTTLPTLPAIARTVPPGQGEPVLVLPGFFAGDGSTWVLRAFLRRVGYAPHGWGLGRNRGEVGRLLPQVVSRVESLAASTGRPVRLVGWSLGGTLAREAARRSPGAVARLVTLGTPVVGGPKYTRAAEVYRRRGVDLDALERQLAERNSRPLPVPVTAIYSRTDGVVAWRACLDEGPGRTVTHLEVEAGHLALGFSAQVLRLVALHLA